MTTRATVASVVLMLIPATLIGQDDPQRRLREVRGGSQATKRQETPPIPHSQPNAPSTTAPTQAGAASHVTPKSPVAVSAHVPVPWSPPVRSPIWSGTIDINSKNTSTGQGDGRFGSPRAPNRTHNGVDEAAPVGTAVHPVAPGVVEFAGWQDAGKHGVGAGFHVRIRHTDGPLKGFSSTYMHLQPDNAITEGKKVSPDDVVGRVGRTGNVPEHAESHVHIQIRDEKNRFVVPNLQPYSDQRGAPRSSNKGDVGGVLINPTPQRDRSRIDDKDAAKVLRQRPNAKSPSWPIELPH